MALRARNAVLESSGRADAATVNDSEGRADRRRGGLKARAQVESLRETGEGGRDVWGGEGLLRDLD